MRAVLQHCARNSRDASILGPSGVFLPPLLLGAVLGRLVAGGLQWATDTVGWDHTFHYGAYAVIGAASMLAGVVRMTLSLTVVVIETTSNVSFGLPIMICLVVCSHWATKVRRTPPLTPLTS
jgi:H+/Cl- antiporter ClcA